MAVLEYRAPSLAANSVSSHFSEDREAAVVLDVACGSGLVAKQVNSQDKKKKTSYMDEILTTMFLSMKYVSSVDVWPVLV